ncbi:MAG: hypothetical protein BWY57_01367 [Betaproteobacteria bacterium ADurb.Bin341]|nr:MAG: hypothetical protein BWY57_01367 [Betaproteobacteria bacterium ADurb.Bin341]
MQLLTTDHQQFAGLLRHHIGRTGAAIDQAHFAKKFAGAQGRQNHLSSFLVAIGHPGAARKEDEE